MLVRSSYRLAVALLIFADAGRASEPPWEFDKVVLANGAVLRGLILEETPAGMRFQNVRRAPGRPAVLITFTLSRGEILKVEPLSAAQRERLAARVRELEEAGTAEKQRAERLEFETIPWADKADAGRRYVSACFVLESDAPEAVVRRAAVRLELVFAAYARYLPPRVETPALPRKTTIELFQSRAGYAARLNAMGRQFVNVACYDPAADRIFGFS